MKLRIKGNSIRLRFSVNEISILKEQGSVAEECVLSPSQTFSYGLTLSENLSDIRVHTSENQMTVYLPKATAQDWLTTDQVGIASTIENGVDEKLRILIEKDWQCMQPRTHEDESDLFPNPRLSEHEG